MANRYTGGELTKRQIKTIEGCKFKIGILIDQLADKELNQIGLNQQLILYRVYQQIEKLARTW